MFFSFNTLANNSLYDQKFPAASISSLCKNSLEWYDDHPGYVGEFDRVFDYCKEYVKDVSPEGFNVNPILSDFGSMNGVNTRLGIVFIKVLILLVEQVNLLLP